MQKTTKKNLVGLIIAALIVSVMILPRSAFAYGGMFDGGELQGIDATCSCTGGLTINVKSYVDDMTHTYMYQPGVTQLYANYNVFSSSGYFLTTLVPFAICLDAEDDCAGSSGQSPEGIFLLTGTSYNFTGTSLMAILKALPAVSEMTRAVSEAQKEPLFVIPKKSKDSRDFLL